VHPEDVGARRVLGPVALGLGTHHAVDIKLVIALAGKVGLVRHLDAEQLALCTQRKKKMKL